MFLPASNVTDTHIRQSYYYITLFQAVRLYVSVILLITKVMCYFLALLFFMRIIHIFSIDNCVFCKPHTNLFRREYHPEMLRNCKFFYLHFAHLIADIYRALTSLQIASSTQFT